MNCLKSREPNRNKRVKDLNGHFAKIIRRQHRRKKAPKCINCTKHTK